VRTATRENAPLDRSYSTSQKSLPCAYGAPLVAIRNANKAKIIQSCCNHWDCPRCGKVLAEHAQERMLLGAGLLMRNGPLYFWTFTCRGKDLDLETADDDYYGWTNRALANLRYHAKKDAAIWTYVQVTERQQRGAAHSHFIHTYLPSDAELDRTDEKGREHYQSAIFRRACVMAGLGWQYDITLINSPMAVALYISGYLTKHAHSDVFPRKWKRVRYSRQWPALPEHAPDWSLPLFNGVQWEKLDKCSEVFETDDVYIYARASRRVHNVVWTGNDAENPNT